MESTNEERLIIVMGALLIAYWLLNTFTSSESFTDGVVDLNKTPLVAYTGTQSQGYKEFAERGKDIVFLKHAVNSNGEIRREWSFKSLIFPPNSKLLFKAHIQKQSVWDFGDKVLKIEASPRFSGILSLHEYLSEDQNLAKPTTLYYDPAQTQHTIIYTVALL